jgi:hypothetical protein
LRRRRHYSADNGSYDQNDLATEMSHIFLDAYQSPMISV